MCLVFALSLYRYFVIVSVPCHCESVLPTYVRTSFRVVDTGPNPEPCDSCRIYAICRVDAAQESQIGRTRDGRGFRADVRGSRALARSFRPRWKRRCFFLLDVRAAAVSRAFGP